MSADVQGETFAHLFTVSTPTFDRAHTLGRVYDSLQAQTFTDFEWVVVDDGSTDGTVDLVDGWRGEAPFPIRYFHQPNSGKHVAENLAIREARGRLITTVDSDDWLLPEALESFRSAWESIPAGQRDGFAGVVGLCVDVKGDLIGTPFPADVLDTTYTELTHLHAVSGDKAGLGQTEVVRRFPFPVIPGETLTAEHVVYARMSRLYRIRCVNKPIKVVEYQAAGLSATGTRSAEFVRNPRTTKLLFHEQLVAGGLPPRALGRAHVNHTRYALHAKLGTQSLRDSPSKALWLATLPFAVFAYLRDRRRIR